MTTRIYLDHNATTPLSPSCIAATTDFLLHFTGNPSSTHQEGREAKRLLNRARETIALELGVLPEEITFTSGCTEAMNQLIRGLSPKRRLISTRLEHSAVNQVLATLSDVHYLDVDQMGAPSPDALPPLSPQDCLVFSAANSETGALLDWETMSQRCQRSGALLLIDGAQILGKHPFKIPKGVTAMAFSAHKFGGPTGIGFFFLRKGVKLTPLLLGGHQENHLRAGTENLLGIAALIGALKDLPQRDLTFIKTLRDTFEQTLLSSLDSVQVNGSGERLANTSNLAFEGVDAEELLIHLDQVGIAASHGSGCASGAMEPSRILREMGYPMERVRSSVRFSFGPTNTLEEVQSAVHLISECVQKLRSYNFLTPAIE